MKPGLYLELFHGRKTPNEQMDDWGEPGPVFGPLKFVHGTYAADLKFEFSETHQDGWFWYTEDLIYYDGMYYGDWSAFNLTEDKPEYFESRLREFDFELTKLPKKETDNEQ